MSLGTRQCWRQTKKPVHILEDLETGLEIRKREPRAVTRLASISLQWYRETQTKNTSRN